MSSPIPLVVSPVVGDAPEGAVPVEIHGLPSGAAATWATLSGKPAVIAGGPTADAARAAIGAESVVAGDAKLAGKAALEHTHTIANVTGLQAAIDGKAPTTHTHTIANVTGLQAAIDAKATVAALTALTARVTALETP